MREKNDDNSQSLSSALNEAQNIVEAARQRASEIERKAQIAYSEAKEKGFLEGLEHGLSQATDKAIRLITETSKLQENLAEEGARLAVAIAEIIIGEHLKISPETSKNLALKALKEAVIGSSVTITINTKDREAFHLAHSEIKNIAGGSTVNIELDDSIARGGCIIRTEFGEIDSKIETLITKIGKHLFEKIPTAR
jgi:flagellar biosynthesis/type III secretory pathway protein FliH